MNTAVFGIGADNHAYISRSGGPWYSLGGDVKQIGAGLDRDDFTKLYGIGTDNSVWAIYPVVTGASYSTNWSKLDSGTVKEISATTDNTVFAIRSDNSVEVNRGDGTGWHGLGGYAKHISATFYHGAHGISHPEVFGIGSDNTVWVNRDDGTGWHGLGGYVKEITATMDNTVFGIGSDNSVWVDRGDGTGWHGLGGYAKHISATVSDGNGGSAGVVPEVFAIGSDNSVWVNGVHGVSGTGWHGLGGYALEIAAPAIDAGAHPFDEVFTIGGSHEGHRIMGSRSYNLGGWLKV